MPVPCIAVEGPLDGLRFQLPSPYVRIYLLGSFDEFYGPIEKYNFTWLPAPHPDFTPYRFVTIDDSGTHHYIHEPPI